MSDWEAELSGGVFCCIDAIGHGLPMGWLDTYVQMRGYEIYTQDAVSGR
jgi:hypothetical protein